MLRSSPFKRRAYVAPPPPPVTPATRTATYAGTVTGNPVSKEDPIQSGPYIAAAKALGYCMHCGARPTPWAPLEFCHRDQGKGAGVKTDCREGWPGCHACHSLLGGHNGGGRMPKEARRALEDALARKTRAAILAAGAWPVKLPMWKEPA